MDAAAARRFRRRRHHRLPGSTAHGSGRLRRHARQRKGRGHRLRREARRSAGIPGQARSRAGFDGHLRLLTPKFLLDCLHAGTPLRTGIPAAILARTSFPISSRTVKRSPIVSRKSCVRSDFEREPYWRDVGDDRCLLAGQYRPDRGGAGTRHLRQVLADLDLCRDQLRRPNLSMTTKTAAARRISSRRCRRLHHSPGASLYNRPVVYRRAVPTPMSKLEGRSCCRASRSGDARS